MSKSSIDNWLQILSPSTELLNAYLYGKWPTIILNPVQNFEEEKFRQFTDLYREEMKSVETDLCIRGLAQELLAGEILTLLCSCHQIDLCHRSVLKTIIEEKMEALNNGQE